LDTAFRLLGLSKPALQFRFTERRTRYLEIAEFLRRRGLVYEDAPGCLVLNKYTRRGLDLIHGLVRPYCSQITFKGDAYSTLAQVVDCIDYNVPLIIDGTDLFMDMMPEVYLFDLVVDALGIAYCPPAYAHVPVICDAEGKPLHKSDSPSDPYLFENWARGLYDGEPTDDPTPVRRALEDLIKADPAKPFSWDNVLRVEAVHIDTSGRRVGQTMFFERGMFCDPYYEEAPDCSN